MNTTSRQVALLIDFENLVRGVSDGEKFDCEALFRLAEEHGRVLVANAYADWRIQDVNQYQTDLYRLGVELIHVLGKRRGTSFKNAVDVKMAVDAIGAISSFAHISVYVIVSGDRDFIHVLKELRRHGKTVIGVSPNASTSNDFAALCDRFVRYEALVRTGDSSATPDSVPVSGAESIDQVRENLREIVEANPKGILGSAIKPMLRRNLSPSFDESTYGFRKMMDFLEQMNDIVQIVLPPGSNGDIRVFPVPADAPKNVTDDLADDADKLIRQTNLKFYRYERNMARRRAILSKLFDSMNRKQPFKLVDIYTKILDDSDDSCGRLSVSILSKYGTFLFQAHAFRIQPNQETLSQRERLMEFKETITSLDDFICVYEANVAYKLSNVVDGDANVDTTLLAKVLGLKSDTTSITYCTDLLNRVPQRDPAL